MSTLIGQITETIHHSRTLRVTGMKGFSSYYLAGKMLTPIFPMRMVELRSSVLLGLDIKEVKLLRARKSKRA